MTRPTQDRIHALSVPTHVGALLVPSATIAEIVNVPELSPLPLAPPWVLGVFGWRTQAVPVVSVEALFGRAPVAPGPASKAVVFYPLAGRSPWEYFALLSASEPRPQTIDGAAVTIAASELPQSAYVAAGLQFGGQSMWIPDFEAWQRAFYPRL